VLIRVSREVLCGFAAIYEVESALHSFDYAGINMAADVIYLKTISKFLFDYADLKALLSYGILVTILNPSIPVGTWFSVEEGAVTR
jgi:hypothetical protein